MAWTVSTKRSAITPLVIQCGDSLIPITLASLPVTAVPTTPSRSDFDEVLAALDGVAHPRLIVVGDDRALATALTRLMRTERLHIELAFVPEPGSAAAKAYGLASGSGAAKVALFGTAGAVPLIRDDAGRAIVGEVRATGSDDGDITGEAYVDNTRLFTGEIPGVEITPTPDQPGLRARTIRRRRFGRRRGKWVPGRAIQIGAEAVVLTRDGVVDPAPSTRGSIYRHHEDWLLVR